MLEIVCLIGLALIAFLLLALKAYSGLTASFQSQFFYNVAGAATSTSLPVPAPSVSSNISIKTSYTLGAGAGQAQLTFLFVQAVTANSTANINLASMTDVLGLAQTSMTKLKTYFFTLLNATQDSTNGTVCSSVTIGAAVSNVCPLDLGGTTPTRTLLNGDQGSYASGSAAGILVSATVKNVLITNNDASNAGALLSGFIGA